MTQTHRTLFINLFFESSSDYNLSQKDHLGFLSPSVFVFRFDKCVLHRIFSICEEAKSSALFELIVLLQAFLINLNGIKFFSCVPKLLRNYFIIFLHALNKFDLSLKLLPNINVLNHFYFFNVDYVSVC